jgi:hypothetical protein
MFFAANATVRRLQSLLPMAPGGASSAANRMVVPTRAEDRFAIRHQSQLPGIILQAVDSLETLARSESTTMRLMAITLSCRLSALDHIRHIEQLRDQPLDSPLIKRYITKMRNGMDRTLVQSSLKENRHVLIVLQAFKLLAENPLSHTGPLGPMAREIIEQATEASEHSAVIQNSAKAYQTSDWKLENYLRKRFLSPSLEDTFVRLSKNTGA